jgi:outer membrane receptor protein involved in Fe transport
MEGVTREQVEKTINATDSEDALKYLPSLLVRKRYIGDYNHAILSSRASGTGNSARSAVYADGILLSNYLGNGVGGLSFPPRWGMVTPEEIERVDVMYGPFSAAYPGNSVGAVVDYVTRMPTQFEAHGKIGSPWSSCGCNTDDTFVPGRPALRRQPHWRLGLRVNFNRTDTKAAAHLPDPVGEHRHAGQRRHPGDRRRADKNNANQLPGVLGTSTVVPHPAGTT